MRLFSRTSTLLAFVALLAVSSAPVMGQTAAKVKKLPFHGKLQAVDTSANTITIEGKTPRVFHLTPTTKITDGSGAPSSLSAAVVGEDVGGSYEKDSAGTMTLFSVRFGAKTGGKAAATAAAAPAETPAPSAPATPPPAAAPAPAPTAEATPAPAPAAAAPATKAKKQKFTGTVVSVDAAAGTVVVHGKADETYKATGATKITDATKKATTLASVTAGQKVSGTYTKSEDGSTNTLVTLKIAK